MGLHCFDSITLVPTSLPGETVLAASHGGTYVAHLALALRLGGLIASDAGIGRERAGVAGLDTLGRYDLPAAAVSVHSARIGDGADCLERGIISVVNEPARRLGIEQGMEARAALSMLSQETRDPVGAIPEPEDEHREVAQAWGGRLVILDSNSLVAPDDCDSIVVTGSHGGLLGGRPASAVKHPVLAAIYNDADGGIEGAGFSRLASLDIRNIAAATVSAWSARIGDGRSTIDDGYVTRINGCARRAGGEIGISCRELVARLTERKGKREP
jgi:hypothetical protein